MRRAKLEKKKFKELFEYVDWMQRAPEDFLLDWQMEALRDHMGEIIEHLLKEGEVAASFWINRTSVGVWVYGEDKDGNHTDTTLTISSK